MTVMFISNLTLEMRHVRGLEGKDVLQGSRIRLVRGLVKFVPAH